MFNEKTMKKIWALIGLVIILGIAAQMIRYFTAIYDVGTHCITFADAFENHLCTAAMAEKATTENYFWRVIHFIFASCVIAVATRGIFPTLRLSFLNVLGEITGSNISAMEAENHRAKVEKYSGAIIIAYVLAFLGMIYLWGITGV